MMIPTFSIKYSRKWFVLWQLLALWLAIVLQVDGFTCTTDAVCMNGGVCMDSGCLCPYGWEGADCGRKVRSRELTTHASNSQCVFYKSCSQCRDDTACGWCDDGSHTGVGKCLPEGASGECSATQWYFSACPDCQCNGHSTCPDNVTCKQPCSNLTIGRNCEKCQLGFWGNPMNGGTCQKCECNGQASLCNSENGKCLCETKGLIGDHCEKCDLQNQYHGDPSKGSCYYDLTIDYQFTFNLSKIEDSHFRKINFRNVLTKADIDVEFRITCSELAKVNISLQKAGGPEKVAFSGVKCGAFRHRFPKTELQFGPENNTTFNVNVYDLKPPLWIHISFSQYPIPKHNLGW